MRPDGMRERDEGVTGLDPLALERVTGPDAPASAAALDPAAAAPERGFDPAASAPASGSIPDAPASGEGSPTRPTRLASPWIRAVRTIPVRRYLLLLAFVCVMLTGVTFSRFIAVSGSDNAARAGGAGTLAIVDEAATGGTTTLFVAPGVDLPKAAGVTFSGSEAATYLYVVVETTGAGSGAWARTGSAFAYQAEGHDLLTWDVASSWTYLTSSGSTHVFYRALAPNEKVTATQGLIVKDGAIHVSEFVQRTMVDALPADLGLRFTARSAQANGAPSAAGALDSWNAIAGS